MMAGQLQLTVANRESVCSWPAHAIMDLSLVSYSLRLLIQQGQRNSVVWLPVAP